MLPQIHNIVGTLVVIAYVVLVILNILRVTGRNFSFAATVSRVAAGLLLVQYILGFILIFSGFRNSNTHYLIALLAIITVGLEHGYAGRRADSQQRAIAATIATLGTAILVIIAYNIGQSYVMAPAFLLIP